MLSEGRPGIDNVYSLHQGELRLEVSKEIYERTGLQGVPQGCWEEAQENSLR